MKKVLGELKDESGRVLLSIKYNLDEVDSMSNVAQKQHARYVYFTGESRSIPIRDSLTLQLSLVGS
jgi:hypothetical protein